MTHGIRVTLSAWQTRNEKVATNGEIEKTLGNLYKSQDQDVRVKLLTRRMENELSKRTR